MKTQVHVRFRKYVDTHKIVIEHLAAEMEINKGSLYNYFNGKTSITLQVLDKFMQLHPGLNIDWLLTGRGHMNINTVENSISEPQEDYDQKCAECKKKDKLIEYLMKDNDRLNKKLDYCENELRKTRNELQNAIESGGKEKRKAG
jgi:AcrR family transcriptional regulator